MKAYRALEKAIQTEIIASAASVGKGGLAVAIMKTAMAGKIGMSADLSKIVKKLGRADFALFSESQGRILVTIAPKDKAKFEKLMKGVPIEKIGKVEKAPAISIKAGGNIRIPLSEALTAYRKRFKNW